MGQRGGGGILCKTVEIHEFCSVIIQPAQTAATRAELHRKSIAQMRVSYHLIFVEH